MARRDLPPDSELVRLVEARIHRECLIGAQLIAGCRRVDRTGAEQRRRRQRNRRRPLLWQIAESAVRASLQLDVQVEVLDCDGASIRDRDAKLVAIDLLIAEKLVAVRFAAWESRGAERNARRAALEAEASAVQVVPVEHVEVEIHLLGVGTRHIAKYLGRGQQLF